MHPLGKYFQAFFLSDKMVELVSGGSLIKGNTANRKLKSTTKPCLIPVPYLYLSFQSKLKSSMIISLPEPCFPLPSLAAVL